MLLSRYSVLFVFFFVGIVLLYSCKSSIPTSISDTPSVTILSEEQPLYDSTFYQGKWAGQLVTEYYQLPLALIVDGDRILLNIPAQNIVKMPVSDIAYELDHVDMALQGQEMKLYTLANEETYLDIERAVGSDTMRARIYRDRDLPVLSRPQNPKPSDAYTSTDITFVNDKDSITLSGTLTSPPSPKSAVILLSGSGPSDRNEKIFEHKPFAVIADHLSKHGVAVLRFDDRGVGESEGSQVGSTTVDFARDAAAAHAYIREQLPDLRRWYDCPDS